MLKISLGYELVGHLIKSCEAQMASQITYQVHILVNILTMGFITYIKV